MSSPSGRPQHLWVNQCSDRPTAATRVRSGRTTALDGWAFTGVAGTWRAISRAARRASVAQGAGGVSGPVTRRARSPSRNKHQVSQLTRTGTGPGCAAPLRRAQQSAPTHHGVGAPLGLGFLGHGGQQRGMARH